MTRYPYGARVLADELGALVPDLVVDPDDLDGLGVYRTFRFTSSTHNGLSDVIAAVADNRIASSRAVQGGVEVVFTTRVVADNSTSFGVADAAGLLAKKRRRKPKGDESAEK